MLTTLPPMASASVSSDHAKAAQLEQQVARQGAAIQGIVASYDQAVSREETIRAKVLDTQAKVVQDQAAQSTAASKLRSLAVDAFVNGSTMSASGGPLALGNVTSLLIQQEYAKVAGASLQDAIDTYKVQERKTQGAEATLRSQQAQAQDTVNVLSHQGQVAQVALAHQNALLGQVKGNLKSLLAAAAKARQAAQQAQEQALAAQQAQQSGVVPPPQVSANAPPGSYADPFRAISNLVPERIDQGVDYSGYGPIYAVGDGTVLSTTNSGWPGGTFISYQLSDGPAAGLVVYAAEDIYPLVQPGQTVTANTPIGTMYEGPDGIETGWAEASGSGTSMANDYGQFSGGNSSAFGYNFSRFLGTVGAPGGVLQSSPTGSLPGGWPSW
ncbi:MAG: hypothetical protein ACRDX8_06690 [Acidimicrobiales bacterium]